MMFQRLNLLKLKSKKMDVFDEVEFDKGKFDLVFELVDIELIMLNFKK